MITQNFTNTHIHITGISDTAFTLGEPTPNSNGVDYLKDGQTYSYITNNGATFEVGTGVFTAATRQLGRVISSSSATDNSYIPWPIGTILRITTVPLMGSNNSGNSDNGGSSDIKVLDSLGESTTSAISQRAATDAVNARVATIDADAGIASMQLDDNGNIVVTDKKGGNHTIIINSVSGDAQTPTDTLYSITNYYVAKDGSLIARDSNGKLWSVPDKDYVTKAIADAGGSSTNTTYALADMSNVTDGTFQARKLSTQQVIDALGFTPLGSDADLSKYAEKDLSNVSAQTIQSLTFVSKQITDALGYVPAKQIDANNLALTDLSNVPTDTLINKIGYTPANSSNTATTSTIKSFDLNSDNTSLTITDKTGGSHTIGGGSSVSLVQDLNGTSTTAAPSQNAVATALQGYVSGMNGSAYSVQGIYAHNTGSGTTVGANENIAVKFTNYGRHQVQVELATQPWVNAYYMPISLGVSGVKSDNTQRSAISNLYIQNLGFNSYNSYCPTVTTKDNNGATIQIALLGRDAAIDHFLSKDDASSTYVSGMNGSAYSVQGIYAHNTGSGTTVGANENIAVKFTNYGRHQVQVELATQPWVNAYYMPISNIVQTTGTSTTNILSQKAISDNYALKTSVPAVIDNLSGTSTTAAPSQNAVATALNALTKRVAALEAKG